MIMIGNLQETLQNVKEIKVVGVGMLRIFFHKGGREVSTPEKALIEDVNQLILASVFC